MKRGFPLLGVLLILMMAGCAAKPTEPLPVLSHVTPFTLTARNGQPFDSQSLAGKIWVADFIFTNCPGPCPRMTTQMRGVQQALAGVSGVELVSFTVDPERDTPEVLDAYAKRFQAGSGWHFLTGPRETLHKLSRESFLLGDVDGKLEHSTRFVLVDGKFRVRGYYASSEQENIRKLLEDIRAIVKEES